MSADPAVWLRAAEDAEQRAKSILNNKPITPLGVIVLCGLVESRCDLLRAAAGEVTRLAALEQAARELCDALDWIYADMGPHARGMVTSVRALLADSDAGAERT